MPGLLFLFLRVNLQLQVLNFWNEMGRQQIWHITCCLNFFIGQDFVFDSYLLFEIFFWQGYFRTFFARFFLTCFLNLAAGNSLQPSPPLEMHPCPPLPSTLGEKEWISCLFSWYKFTTSRTSQNESNPRITTCPKLLLPPASAAQRLLALRPPRPFLLLAEKRRLWSFIWNFTTLKSEQCTIIFGQAFSISQLLTFELCMFEQW